ncbi:MAG: hypothetical protein ACKO23_06030, partial [Gemmataceae bacterium]
MVPLIGFLLLFLVVAGMFLYANQLLGQRIRSQGSSQDRSARQSVGEAAGGSLVAPQDLRFFFLPLLLIALTVVAAFFFPWAQVFGKANAISWASVPTAQSTPADYRAFASKVVDLACPVGSVTATPLTPGIRSGTGLERSLWTKRANLSDEELLAFRGLDAPTSEVLRSLGNKAGEQARSLTAEQLALVKRHGTALNEQIDRINGEQKESLKNMGASLKGLPKERYEALDRSLGGGTGPLGGGNRPVVADLLAVGVDGLLNDLGMRPDVLRNMLSNKSVQELQRLNPVDAELLGGPAGGTLRTLQKVIPDQIKAMLDQGRKHRDDLMATAAIAEAELTKSGPQQRELWQALTPRALKTMGGLSATGLEQVRSLTPEGILAMRSDLVPGAKSTAENLSLMALFEFLFFIGVLLAGLAYL